MLSSPTMTYDSVWNASDELNRDAVSRDWGAAHLCSLCLACNKIPGGFPWSSKG